MTKEKIIASDYLDMKFVEDIQVTTEYVAWVERKPDELNQSYTSSIKVLNKNTGKIKQFTNGKKMDNSPRFSPDGTKLAFLSTRAEKSQLFVIDLDGGEARQLTTLSRGVSNISWSPNSNYISFLSNIDPTNFTLDEEKPKTKIEAEIKKIKMKEDERLESDPKVISSHVYRTGTSYLKENEYSHIFYYDLNLDSVKIVSEGKFNFSGAAWKGNDTLYSVTKREDPVHLSLSANLVSFDRDKVSAGTDICEFRFPSALFLPTPIISDDAEILVNVFSEGDFHGQNSKWAKLEGESLSEIINEKLDRSIVNYKWIDSRTGYCLIDDTGTIDLRKYSFDDKTFTKVFDTESVISYFDFQTSDEIYFIGSDTDHPSAVWKWTKKNGLVLIYDPNQEFLDNKLIINPQEFWLTNPEGIKYQGWFFETPHNDKHKPPLVLSIHGGPHVNWTSSSLWLEWQMFLSAGYSILAMNPIGSSGYGEEFAQIITAKWGVDDARDLLAAVDHFIDKVDKDRLYITGGSYAGFQTANIISRDHRFKAACAQRGVYNVLNFWMGTDIPIWAASEWGWDFRKYDFDVKYLWEHSPVGRAHLINTPLLIIHSENDYRVQISQAEELFGALKMQNKEALFVRYPRDGHELSRSGEPDHLIDRLERMLDWFEKHQ